MKNRYLLLINHGKTGKHPYTYSYGQTKDIQIHLSFGGAGISFTQTSGHNWEKIRSGTDRLCADAIKKALLLHILLYGKPLVIGTCRFLENGTELGSYDYRERNVPLIHSMVRRELDHPLPESWKREDVIRTILNSPKSGYDGRHRAFIALLTAKTRSYAIEKSLYCWMAMSGFYCYLAEEAVRYGQDAKNLKEDWQKQNLLCCLAGISPIAEERTNAERQKIVYRGLGWLKHCSLTPEELYQAILREEAFPRAEELQDILNSLRPDMKPVSFLSVWLPYRIRCDTIHTNEAIPLFAYAEDPLVKALTYTNYFSEMLVENQLPEWLRDRELTGEQKERLREIL